MNPKNLQTYLLLEIIIISLPLINLLHINLPLIFHLNFDLLIRTFIFTFRHTIIIQNLNQLPIFDIIIDMLCKRRDTFINQLLHLFINLQGSDTLILILIVADGSFDVRRTVYFIDYSVDFNWTVILDCGGVRILYEDIS